ncbi:hypothetical protein DNTS_033356 [Danionella cerebrum]|uniref:Poly [ADP-ribose] polymerase n=1 Tax=Danionella cerebrum TaxID=2873325 RepID=A0A553QJQ1_9TELE|nr:hypothetical protein DNTS_033356 [Danionella translucida]
MAPCLLELSVSLSTYILQDFPSNTIFIFIIIIYRLILVSIFHDVLVHDRDWPESMRNSFLFSSGHILGCNSSCSYLLSKLHGAAYGKGIYLSPISSISFGYSGMGKGQHRMPTKDELVQRYNRMNTMPQSRPIQSRFLQSRNLNCIALCEGKTAQYEDGQVGDANINTQEPKIQKEIMRVIGTQIYSS